MTRILTHVHVFYPKIWPEIKSCLMNMDAVGVDWDLFVTIVEEHPGLREDILAFKPGADVRMVENRGYDVWPFISVLQDVGVAQYDYIVKLHTKRDMPYGVLLGRHHVGQWRWRKRAISFVRTKEHLSHCLNVLDTDPAMGMCADYRLIIDREKIDPDPTAIKEAKAFVEKMSLPNDGFRFVAGTMFIARASAFLPLLSRPLTIDDFPPSSPVRKTSMAHTLERVFGLMFVAQELKIEDVFTPLSERGVDFGFYALMVIRRFLWQAKVTRSGRLIVKICKIPVYVGR